MLWSAEEMLEGQQQKMDIPAHDRTSYKGLFQERLEEVQLNGTERNT